MGPYSYSIGFSSMMDEQCRSLPITYFTPLIIWRDTKRPLAIESVAILLLSVLHSLNLDRQTLEGPSMDRKMKEVTDVLYTTPYCPPVPKMVSSQTLANVVQELVAKDKELEQKMHDKDKELEQKMYDKDKELEQKMHDKDKELKQKIRDKMKNWHR